VVLGPDFWKREFASAPSSRQDDSLEWRRITVIGVAPETFRGC